MPPWGILRQTANGAEAQEYEWLFVGYRTKALDRYRALNSAPPSHRDHCRVDTGAQQKRTNADKVG